MPARLAYVVATSAALLACSCSPGRPRLGGAGAPAPAPVDEDPASLDADDADAEDAGEAEEAEGAEDEAPLEGILIDVPRRRQSRSRAERQWRHVERAAQDDCREALSRTGARFHSLPDTRGPDPRGCGMPRGVIVTQGPTGILYSPPMQIDCSLALRLVDIEDIIQAEAEKHLDAPIARIGTLGSFACRHVRGSSGDGRSEHAFGNAVDFAHFLTRRGRQATVLRHYAVAGEMPLSPEARFLRAVEKRLFTEGSVSHVFGPDYDMNHRTHLHIDCGLPHLLW